MRVSRDIGPLRPDSRGTVHRRGKEPNLGEFWQVIMADVARVVVRSLGYTILAKVHSKYDNFMNNWDKATLEVVHVPSMLFSDPFLWLKKRMGLAVDLKTAWKGLATPIMKQKTGINIPKKRSTTSWKRPERGSWAWALQPPRRK